MRHLSRHWLLVARLKGFLFFGSAQTIGDAITKRMEGQGGNPLLALRFIVIDFTVVDGLDASAAKCLQRVAKVANEHGIRVLWCGVNSSTVSRLNNSGTIQSQRDLFEDLGLALAFVEQKILGYILHLQKFWLGLSPGLAVYNGLLSQQVAFEPFQDVLTSDASRCGCPWKFCGKVSLRKYETILWKPGECNDLFLVHSGSVGLFTSVPKDPAEAWGHLVATYERGSFLNRGAVGMQGANTYWAVAMNDGEALSWNQTQLHMMDNEQPAMASALKSAVLTQETQDARHASTGPYSIPTILQAASDANETTPWLPGSLRRLEAGVATTRWLCELGLLGTVTPTNAHPAAAVVTSCPPLPRTLVDVLRIAFRTFSESDSLGAAAAGAALKYAGLHDCVLLEESEQVFTEAEFLELASEVAMKRLGESQEVMLRSLFIEQASMNPESQTDASLSGGSATIPRAKLTEFFEAKIGLQGQSLEEVMGVANVWMADQRDCLNADMFVGIMSRIAKLHSKYWHVTDGFDKLAKAGASPGARGITAEMLVAASQELSEQLDIEKAREMITMAGFIDHDGLMDSCDVFKVAAFVSTMLNPPARSLPPKPKKVKASLIQEALPKRTRSKSNMGHPWARDDIQLDPSMFGEGERDSGPPIKRTFSMNSRVFLGEELPEEKDSCAFKLHVFLEKPESSRTARAFSLFMAMMIVCSVVTLVFEPLISPGSDIPQSEKEVWFTMDGFFSVLFTVELTLRFAVADAAGKQTHWQFVKAPLNIADVAAVLPWYIEVVTRGDPGSDQRLLRVARLMRLARVVRLGRLARKWAVLAPIAVVFVVIWGIFLKNGLSSAC